MIKLVPSIWKTTIFTLVPEAYPGLLGVSLIGSGLRKGLWKLNIVNIRDFSLDKNLKIDDKIFGGTSGMVLRPDIINRSLEKRFNKQISEKIIYFSPRGRNITQEYLLSLLKIDHVGLLCGRFEGIDQRILDVWNIEEVSLGDFIISGGDIAAVALIDSIVRFIPGILGGGSSLDEESFISSLLEYPHYTRPNNWIGLNVPRVLKSGNHVKIRNWRCLKSEIITKVMRSDLWNNYLKLYNNKD